MSTFRRSRISVLPCMFRNQLEDRHWLTLMADALR